MNIEDIKTPDDFEQLSESEKLVFKSEHQLAYKKLFSTGDEPKKFDWRNHTQELNFYPSQIKTPDDFENLTDAGKLYVREQFPLVYKGIFSNRG
jgi:hypothetical protein